MLMLQTPLSWLLLGMIAACCAAPALAAGKSEQEGPVKYVRFRIDKKRPCYGIVEGDRVRRLEGNLFRKWRKTDETVALSDVEILVPSKPSKIIALAGNYRDHLGDTAVPEYPEPFYKPPSCLQQQGGEIVQPADHDPVHYEAELVIVIGKRARKVTEADALDYVLGVTCGNDVSARNWQKNDVQWWRAKGTDTFGPCGPFIVSGLDYNHLDVELRVNGETKHKTNTSYMVHNVAGAVSFISQYLTLEPGDLIFTGTSGKTQPLSIGDVVEVEIEGVGVLRNRVVAAK